VFSLFKFKLEIIANFAATFNNDFKLITDVHPCTIRDKLKVDNLLYQKHVQIKVQKILNVSNIS